MYFGLQPDMLVCRTVLPLGKEEREKIALFCSIPPEMVIEARDVNSIYQIPLNFEDNGVGNKVVSRLGLASRTPDLSGWRDFVRKVENPAGFVRIAICGKYTDLKDSYKSIIEAFVHAGVENNAKVELKWLDAEKIEKNGAQRYMQDVTGLLIPGGFGERGIEGKIKAIQYARENKIPFFGICLGLQCAVIEFARNICSLKDANSTEFDPTTANPVIDLMETQVKITDKGGTMRLGAYTCVLKKNTKGYKAYGKPEISERHRHRYEFNNDYLDIFKKKDFIFSGHNPKTGLIEMIEMPDHPWFVGVQFHPELKSRVLNAHPLFRDFVKAAIEKNIEINNNDAMEDMNEKSNS